MTRVRTRRRVAVATASALVAVIGTAISVWASEAPARPISACLDDRGDLHAVTVGESTVDPCRPGESVLSWGIAGADGTPGPVGAGRVPAETIVFFDDMQGRTAFVCETTSRAPCTFWTTVDLPDGHVSYPADQLAVARLDDLPAHRAVRVQASVHHIDRWEGEAAFLGVDDEVVLVDPHHHCAQVWHSSCAGISALRNESYSDRVGTIIDVVVPHTGSALTLEFGSTVSGPGAANAFLGLDDVTVAVVP